MHQGRQIKRHKTCQRSDASTTRRNTASRSSDEAADMYLKTVRLVLGDEASYFYIDDTFNALLVCRVICNSCGNQRLRVWPAKNKNIPCSTLSQKWRVVKILNLLTPFLFWQQWWSLMLFKNLFGLCPTQHHFCPRNSNSSNGISTRPTTTCSSSQFSSSKIDAASRWTTISRDISGSLSVKR